MAVKIRLRRVGAKKQPAYRLVIADARSPRDGRFIEIVGSYNPLTNPATVQINYERVLYWLGQGAQPTEVVKDMFVRKGLWDVFTGKAEMDSLYQLAPVVEEIAVAVVDEEVAPVEIIESAPLEEVVVAEEAAPLEEAPSEDVAVATPGEETAAVDEETPAE